MKKLSLITAIAGILIAHVSTQAQGLYAGLGVGYGFPSQVQPFNYYASTNTATTNTSNSYSLGSGMSVGIFGGYMLNKNIGIQLGISDKFSSSNTVTSTNTSIVGSL